VLKPTKRLVAKPLQSTENGQGIELSQQLYKPNAARNFVKKLCKKKSPNT
jgi:hypothetical protein